ncbi:MAG: glycosyltransferase [Flavobacteriales bacterium]
MQISFIIPVKNGEATIVRALQSVLSQHGVVWEAIVMDGLSSDNTIQRIESLGDERIHYHTGPDHGVYDAMNAGVQRAKGDWIYIMGADDELASEDVFDALLRAVRSQDIMVMGVIENRGCSNRWVAHHHRSHFAWTTLFRNTVHQQGVIYRKDWLLKHPFHSGYQVLADYDVHLQAYRQFGWKSAALRPWMTTAILIARCDASGISKQFTWSLYREELAIRCKQLGWFIWLVSLPVVMMKYVLKRDKRRSP